mgnify:CR=1 FL=1
MSKPKISIITVCFNSEKHLEEAIQSVVNQDYENKEYIVIDGGSTDGTLGIIGKYRDKIDYFVSEPDKGISDAFNKGIMAATGDLIGILNSDDFMMQGALSKVAVEYEDGVDVYRGYELLYFPTRNVTKAEYPNNRFGRIPIGNCICHEAAFLTKEIYKKVGLYRVELKYAMDLDLFMRLYRLNAKHKFINVCVLTFRVGGASSAINGAIIKEKRQLVIDNGGNLLDAFIYVCYHRLKQLIKRLVFMVWPK